MKVERRIKLYVDAGTKKNGQRGFQQTRVCVTDERGIVLFEKYIGDYTNNEGEILAIIAALKNVHPDKRKSIYSDSKIAVNWVMSGWGPKNRKTYLKTNRVVFYRRLDSFIYVARILKTGSDSIVTWVPREQNRAGQYLEDKYGT